jgi:hypothetical protein
LTPDTYVGLKFPDDFDRLKPVVSHQRAMPDLPMQSCLGFFFHLIEILFFSSQSQAFSLCKNWVQKYSLKNRSKSQKKIGTTTPFFSWYQSSPRNFIPGECGEGLFQHVADVPLPFPTPQPIGQCRTATSLSRQCGDGLFLILIYFSMNTFAPRYGAYRSVVKKHNEKAWRGTALLKPSQWREELGCA